ncbi:amino acid ABC transporter permease [Parasedimentitalea maritima]|uniref:ABC transporter permease subunit n=1 Tax=Parasedimentitalea maritima TaxID=2578117 RepID=A0A6A4RAE4_9RHOB|nr:amino acid ABC transporter permease [Zongyanglinia marina]KAE9629036.1 ABC transporter permease subunit [Zongyanglinia marina]
MEILDIFFNVSVMQRAFPILLRGLTNTIVLGFTAIFFGGILGVLVCLVRLYAPKPLRLLAVAYIDLLRAIPILVVLILVYYALPFAGITLSSFVAAAVALSMVLAAYSAEVVRAGIEAVPKGQFEAATALGLSFPRTMQKVILPQALRIVIPPLASYSVSIFKDTSLASVVAMNDLLKQATDAQALFANPTPLILAAVFYIVLLWPLVRFTSRLEERFKQAYGR